MTEEHTEIIVLRSTPYKESGVIISGLSPELGKIELISYHANSSSSKKFPVIDLFRRLEISFKPPPEHSNSELGTITAAELIEEFSGLPKSMENMEFAAKIGSFILRNSVYSEPLALVFDALRNVLFALSSTDNCWSKVQCAVIIKLTFLYENGLLPEPEGMAEEQKMKILNIYESIVESAVSGERMPELSAKYFKALDQYLNELIAGNNLLWR